MTHKSYFQLRDLFEKRFGTSLPKLREIDVMELSESGLAPPAAPLTEDEAAKSVAVGMEDLRNELRSLTGLVVVDGAFAPGRIGNTDAIVFRFTDSPATFFWFAANTYPMARGLFASGPRRVRVLATVLSAMNERGQVELRPLAIF